VAGFSSNTPIVLGAGAVFTNTTTGTPPITYEWDFGDGSPVVTDVNPSHVYTQTGTFTVVLTATNEAGSDTFADDFVVTVPTAVSLTAFAAAPVAEAARLAWLAFLPGLGWLWLRRRRAA
jgi:PKD repeat protein